MIGARLIYLRKQKGLTQEGLAKELGLPRTTYAGYENESREPDLGTLIKLADYFETSLDFIFGRTDNQKLFKLDGNEYIVFHEMKQHPFFQEMLRDLASDPERKVKKLIKVWRIIREETKQDT